MPNRQSAKKHLRADKRKRQINMRVKSATRTAIKKAKSAILANAPEAEENFRLAVKQIDKAASKGVIKEGKADRTKSRLAKKLNAMKNS